MKRINKSGKIIYVITTITTTIIIIIGLNATAVTRIKRQLAKYRCNPSFVSQEFGFVFFLVSKLHVTWRNKQQLSASMDQVQSSSSHATTYVVFLFPLSAIVTRLSGLRLFLQHGYIFTYIFHRWSVQRKTRIAPRSCVDKTLQSFGPRNLFSARVKIITDAVLSTPRKYRAHSRKLKVILR